MTRWTRTLLTGLVAALMPLSLATLPAAADDPSPRTVSGTLPGGGAFTLPPVGQPPFPVSANPSGIAGGVPSATVEPAPPYVPQTSCDPSEKPGITAFKRLVLAQYPGTGDWGSVRNCTDDGISEHLEGRAWDWHADVRDAATFAAAANVLQWLTANDGKEARRLGIMYIGYNYRIWGAYRASEGWRTLNNSNPHTDHVHFSFTWNGAMAKTSFWTGNVAATDYGPCRPFANQPAPIRAARNASPCPTPDPLPTGWQGATLLWRGSTGDLVRTVQAKLAVTPVSGTFGAATQNAVAAFQRQAGLPVTGAVDAATWFGLGMGIAGPIGGTPGTTTGKLRYGMIGPAVKKLQRALRMQRSDRTGYFGAKTRQAVKRWQRAHGRKPTGVVNLAMRNILGV